MMRYFPFLVILLFAGIGSQAQPIKDTLFFNNGTLVIGKLKKVKLGVVTFDPDDANDITVQLRKLKGIEASTKIFRVETINNRVIFGYLQKNSVPGVIRIIQGEDTVRLPVQDISNLYPYDETFFQRFTGNLGLGYSYTKSSGFGRFNYDASITYRSKKEEVSLYISGIYTIADSGLTRDNENYNLKYNYYFSPTSFFTTFFAYQRNLELGLQRRYQEGIGLGNKFITSRYMYAWARGGTVFNQEKSTQDEYSGLLTELFGQVQLNFFRFTKPEVNVSFYQTVYYSLSQHGRFRNDGTLDLTWEIVKDLKLNLQFYHNYDSKPPVSGSSTIDWGTVIGFKYVLQ